MLSLNCLHITEASLLPLFNKTNSCIQKMEGAATTLPLANTWKKQFDLSHRSSCTIKAFQGERKKGARGVYNSFLSLPTPCLFFQQAQNCGRLSQKHTVRLLRKPA